MAEMSLFYPMKKYAAYIPALARIEEFHYFWWRNRKDATTAFLDHVKFPEKEMLLWVYDGGETFYDWNFPNLRTYADPAEIKKHLQEAEYFLENGPDDDNPDDF